MKKEKPILKLSEADFIAFLYSERERENNLSHHQGWTNWALIGAFITVVCAIYAFLRTNSTICWADVVFYSSSLTSFFLAYKSWLLFFKRNRGIDYSKVRILKEMIPYAEILTVLLSSVIFAITIHKVYGLCPVFWLWILVIIMFIVVFVAALYLKDRIVPSYFGEEFFPSDGSNMIFRLDIGLVYAAIIWASEKYVTSNTYLCAEFEIGICITTLFALFYLFLIFNSGDKVVKKLDVLIDQYIYAGKTREYVISEITKNRMGYGALEVCSKELSDIEDSIKDLKGNEEKVESFLVNVTQNVYDSRELLDIGRELGVIMKNQKVIISKCRALSDRLKEMFKTVPMIEDVSEFNMILDICEAYIERMDKVTDKIATIIKLVKEKDQQMALELD